jgi:tetratricopeptide (TPR) repeat protein
MFQPIDTTSALYNIGIPSDQAPNRLTPGKLSVPVVTCSNSLLRSSNDMRSVLQRDPTMRPRPVSSNLNQTRELRSQPPLYNKAVANESTAVFLETAQMGDSLHESGHLTQALLCYRAALHCKNNTIRSEPSAMQEDFASVLFKIGAIHMSPTIKDDAQCLDAFHNCLDLRRACLGTLHGDVAAVLFMLASVHSSLGDQQYALELLVESVSILLVTCPDNTEALVKVWTALGLVQEALGEAEDAASSMKEIQKLTCSS